MAKKPDDDQRFDVTIQMTNGETIHREDLADDVASEFENLPFTAPDVAVVQVTSTKSRKPGNPA